MQPDDNDLDSPDDHFSMDDSSESEWENKEGDTSEEVGDCADCLNLGSSSELPFLAQAVNSSPSLLPPPSSASTLTQHGLSHEEGGEPPSHMDQPTHSSTSTHSYNFCHQSPLPSTSSPAPSQLSPPLAVPPQLVKEQLAASEKRNKELQHEVERLKTHCVLLGGVITHLQKKVNTKETKKKSSAYAKKTTGEARVLTSKEGHQELQQLCEESWQKEMRQNAELAWKAAEEQAQREHRANPTHIFIGLLNKS